MPETEDITAQNRPSQAPCGSHWAEEAQGFELGAWKGGQAMQMNKVAGGDQSPPQGGATLHLPPFVAMGL